MSLESCALHACMDRDVDALEAALDEFSDGELRQFDREVNDLSRAIQDELETRRQLGERAS